MKYLTLAILPAAVLCGCATTQRLQVEVRAKVTAPRVERIHLVQHGSIGSSELHPSVIREDAEYRYYKYSDLLDGTRGGFLVVDFDSTPQARKRTEVYDLSRSGVCLRDGWSDWLSPQSLGRPDQWGSVSFQILRNMKEASNAADSAKKDTQFRYRVEKWKY